MRAWPPSPRPPLELEPPVLLRSAAAMTLNSERCSRRHEMVVMEVLVVVVAAARDAVTSAVALRWRTRQRATRRRATSRAGPSKRG